MRPRCWNETSRRTVDRIENSNRIDASAGDIESPIGKRQRCWRYARCFFLKRLQNKSLNHLVLVRVDHGNRVLVTVGNIQTRRRLIPNNRGGMEADWNSLLDFAHDQIDARN